MGNSRHWWEKCPREFTCKKIPGYIRNYIFVFLSLRHISLTNKVSLNCWHLDWLTDLTHLALTVIDLSRKIGHPRRDNWRHIGHGSNDLFPEIFLKIMWLVKTSGYKGVLWGGGVTKSTMGFRPPAGHYSICIYCWTSRVKHWLSICSYQRASERGVRNAMSRGRVSWST